MGFEILGGVSGLTADVDSGTRGVKALVQPGSQTAITNLYGQTFEVGNNGRVRISPDSVVINDLFTGSALNTNIWAPSTSAMTIAAGTGLLTLNANSTLTSGSFAVVNSILQPYYTNDYSTYVHLRVIPTFQTNAVIEFGWGNVAGAVAPTDGFFFRINGSGVMSVVMSYGGTETVSTASGPMTAGTAYEIELEIFNDSVKWYVATAAGVAYFTDPSTITDDLRLFTPPGQIRPVQLATDPHMPAFARVYNSAATSAAAQLKIGTVNFAQRDMFRTKNWTDVQAGQGRAAYQGPSPSSLIQTANHANSASPASATLSNTAAGYTTFGGKWQFAAVAGAATDFALFGFQVPPNFQLYIQSVTLSSVVTGAAVATTATILDWSLGVNSSAVSLATAESPPTSWAPRRIPLGVQGFVVGAAVGTVAADLVRNFPTPVVCDGGRFVHVILQIPVGTATASEVFRGDVMINGYYE